LNELRADGDSLLSKAPQTKNAEEWIAHAEQRILNVGHRKCTGGRQYLNDEAPGFPVGEAVFRLDAVPLPWRTSGKRQH
jgi:hypothetical protein